MYGKVETEMVPIYHEPWFTFRFDEDRTISRFHVEGVDFGRQIWVFKIDPATGQRLELLAMAEVGKGGWVDLDEPLFLRAGDAFIAEPEPLRLTSTAAKLSFEVFLVVAGLAAVGFICGVAQGRGNQLILAAWCGAVGVFVVLLGYGSIALLIVPIGYVAKLFRWKKSSDAEKQR
jgi:hypothetical protein